MLDRDLAAIYQVLTKRLNEQVRRNIERFPDEFMFQLTKDEMNELVANCDRLKTMKHSSVAMLDMLAKRGRGVKVELVTHSNGESAADSYCVFDDRQVAVVGEEMVKHARSSFPSRTGELSAHISRRMALPMDRWIRCG